jgi:hypothetical protein
MLVFHAQDALFDLIERQVRRLAVEAPQLAFKYTRGKYPCSPNNVIQLTLKARGGIAAKLSTTR